MPTFCTGECLLHSPSESIKNKMYFDETCVTISYTNTLACLARIRDAAAVTQSASYEHSRKESCGPCLQLRKQNCVNVVGREYEAVEFAQCGSHVQD